MTDEAHRELLIRVNCLLHNASVHAKTFGCAQKFIVMLPGLTFGGQFVLHLNEQYIEIIDLLWEDLCKGTYADGDVRANPVFTLGCAGCGKP